jgi:UDPglucose 6-dehydrogenase
VTFCSSPYEAASGADGLIIVTEWNQFRKLQFDELAQALRRPLVVDLRNLYNPREVADAGLRYVSVGRPTAEPAAATSSAGASGAAVEVIAPAPRSADVKRRS